MFDDVQKSIQHAALVDKLINRQRSNNFLEKYVVAGSDHRPSCVLQGRPQGRPRVQRRLSAVLSRQQRRNLGGGRKNRRKSKAQRTCPCGVPPSLPEGERGRGSVRGRRGRGRGGLRSAVQVRDQWVEAAERNQRIRTQRRRRAWSRVKVVLQTINR